MGGVMMRRLSRRGMGEWVVSYVLAIATPFVGVRIQGGEADASFFLSLIPLFLINFVRMMVMNTPDKEGDEAGGKITSVVMIGERQALIFHNITTLFVYALLLPVILPPYVSGWVIVGYYLPLPFRFWIRFPLSSPLLSTHFYLF